MSQPTARSASRAVGTALIVAALAITGTAIGIGITRGSTPGGVPAGFVYAQDGDLMLDGAPFRYAGANSYTLMFESQGGVDVAMKVYAEEELRVARAWAFLDVGRADGSQSVEISNRNVYFQYWDEEVGKPVYNTGENGLEKLDYMIYSAGQHGVKLVLPLVNNWTAFGGMDQYVKWADGEYHDDFLTDPEIKQWYKDWVATVLERENVFTGVKYKDDPAIMAWELGNEMRCSDSGPYPSSPECGSDMFVAWADEMSTFVKSIDPHHLVGFGGEGFLCTEPASDSTLVNCTESGDPAAMLALPNIDIHGIHVYPNHWQPQEPTDDWEDWAVWWIEQHGQLAADAGKPFYIGEYGWIESTKRPHVFDRWLRAFHDAGGDGSHFWLMQPASSISPPADMVGFSQRCPGTACEVVSNWTRYLNGASWDDFRPLAIGDFATAQPGDTVIMDVLANDLTFGDSTWDRATVDLDPETPGVQTTVTTERGTFTVADGVVTFVSETTASGLARISYVATDSFGRESPSAQIAVSHSSAD